MNFRNEQSWKDNTFREVNIAPSEEGHCTIGLHDVLCGRSKMAFNNVGNRRFRVIVSLSLNSYVNEAKSRKEKSRVIRNIVESTKACGGRFLQFMNGDLRELSEREAHDKVGHAVRDMAMARDKSDSSSFDVKAKPMPRRQSLCENVSTSCPQNPPLTIDVQLPDMHMDRSNNSTFRQEICDYGCLMNHDFDWEDSYITQDDFPSKDISVASLDLLFSKRLSIDTIGTIGRRSSMNTTTSRRSSMNTNTSEAIEFFLESMIEI
jgi:hypothetical protein